jgi:hypothetical protein
MHVTDKPPASGFHSWGTLVFEPWNPPKQYNIFRHYKDQSIIIIKETKHTDVLCGQVQSSLVLQQAYTL